MEMERNMIMGAGFDAVCELKRQEFTEDETALHIVPLKIIVMHG
jgi:hypothetical protein